MEYTVGSIAVMTSGGDAPGMNPAVRSVVRSSLDLGIETYAIYEGYYGMVQGGDYIRSMSWEDVGGILQQGGTMIGTARSDDFRTREGRRKAALNLVLREIDSLIVIGGDGSLTGADIFRKEWPGLLDELVERGDITSDRVERRSNLRVVGLVGSIDNDMFGTDMTIGADTALHRITEAIDSITSTASSHQRAFVIEVMGRNCGYLALMASISSGADWVLIPESPPDVEDWEQRMCDVLQKGREVGRRHSIVVVAEGACDRDGNPIETNYVKSVLKERIGADTRVTILGHVQRGGAPSAYDRLLGSLLGHAAVQAVTKGEADEEPQLLGIRQNRVQRSSLLENVEATHSVADFIAERNYEKAMELRGGSFKDAFRTLRTLIRAKPHAPDPERRRRRIAILHAGSPAPGMNTAVRAATRLAIDQGHEVLGVHNGFPGLLEGNVTELGWMSVSGFASRGGAELGTNRTVPSRGQLPAIAERITDLGIEGLLMIGGWAGYEAASLLHEERHALRGLDIPVVCVPATINNNLPGSELAVGADTALNNIMEAVDKIKQSAVASRRVFVVEVMGRHCGYLALMSGIAGGAERVYLNEEGISLRELQSDVQFLVEGFESGKRLGLMIRNEEANRFYTTDFMRSLFEEESEGLFDARQAILGHLQNGGDPSPFDRIQATRLAGRALSYILEQIEGETGKSAFMGLVEGAIRFNPIDHFAGMVDEEHQRPREQWWLKLREIARLLGRPAPRKKPQ
ncbi:MAG: 6-phosphofructokinase [Spirochaetes bacterium]|jgi:6-phosphofructokinase 1|nr:6-phosphofructokinase [Spirochaetota bacterium]